MIGQKLFLKGSVGLVLFLGPIVFLLFFEPFLFFLLLSSFFLFVEGKVSAKVVFFAPLLKPVLGFFAVGLRELQGLVEAQAVRSLVEVFVAFEDLEGCLLSLRSELTDQEFLHDLD